MECPRCQGLMVQDHFVDMKDTSESLWLPVSRCMNCGEVVDPRITARRALKPTEMGTLLEAATRIVRKRRAPVRLGA